MAKKTGLKDLTDTLSKAPKKANPFAKKGEPMLEDEMDPMVAGPEDALSEEAGMLPEPPPMPMLEGEEPMPPVGMGRDLGGPQMEMGGGTDTAALLSRVLGLAEALAAQLPAKL